ncbi:MAG: glycosyltransferase, partial [Chloroflexota bacterium]
GFETILAAAKILSYGELGGWGDGENVSTHLIPPSQIEFLIVGDGTRRAWLESELAKGEYPNVTLLPYQPRSAVPQIYATADICLVPLKKETALGTFPSKIYTIMAARRPVIASTDPHSELADLVAAAQCGWIIPPENSAKLTAAIQSAADNKITSSTKGGNGYNHIHAHYGRRSVTQMYSQLFSELTEGSHRKAKTKVETTNEEMRGVSAD